MNKVIILTTAAIMGISSIAFAADGTVAPTMPVKSHHVHKVMKAGEGKKMDMKKMDMKKSDMKKPVVVQKAQAAKVVHHSRHHTKKM